MSRIRTEIAQDRSGAFLEYCATNRVTAGFASAFLGVLALLPFGLTVASVANKRIDLAFAFFALTVGIVWAIKRFVWTPKTYRITFRASEFQAGAQSFRYEDIAAFGVGSFGGDAYDPASMSLPRNTTPGPHVFVSLKSDPRQRPVTVTVSHEVSKEIALEIERIMNVMHVGRSS